MSDVDWSKRQESFTKDGLTARVAELETILAQCRAEGRQDPTPLEATRDFLAGRLAVLQGDLPAAEQKFGSSVAAFQKAEMSQQRATVAIEAATAMQSGRRLDSALRFAEEAIAGAELVWWGLSPAERLTVPRIVVEAADVAIPIACEAQADEKAFDFIQRSKARWSLEQLWMHRIATLPISAAFKDPHGPAPEFEAALRQLDAAWDACFSGDVVEQRPAAEDRVVSAYGAEAVRRRRLRPLMASTDDAATCRKALHEGEALLELFVTTKDTFAALLTRDQLRVEPLGISANKLREGVAGGYLLLTLAPVRRDLESAINQAADVERKEMLGAFGRFVSPRKFLRDTHDLFLKPFASELLSIRRLVVCPHWVLHLVPFHAVESAAGTPLADTTAVTYAPSASVWKLLRSQAAENPASAPLHVAVFGIERRPAAPQPTWFSKKLGRTDEPEPPSEFEKEARAVAATYSVEPLIGPGARKDRLLDAFTAADCVHVSCHAVGDRPQAFTDGLLLADGLLSLAELSASPRLTPRPGTEVSPSVIVLSACQSGLPKVEAGDRLFSLGHALMHRLGGCVISSLWRADAESTSLLMAKLHEHRKTVPDWAEALRLAQRDTMLAASKPRPGQPPIDFRDPYYWAGFFVLGAA